MTLCKKCSDQNERENLPSVKGRSSCYSCTEVNTCGQFTDIRIRTSAVAELKLIFDLLSDAVCSLHKMLEDDVFVSIDYEEQYHKCLENKDRRKK